MELLVPNYTIFFYVFFFICFTNLAAQFWWILLGLKSFPTIPYYQVILEYHHLYIFYYSSINYTPANICYSLHRNLQHHIKLNSSCFNFENLLNPTNTLESFKSNLA